MSIKNKQVSITTLRALNRMRLIRDETPDLSDVQMANINKAIQELRLEYIRISGLSINSKYSKIAGSLSDAADALNAIKDDRKKLENKFVSAQRIASAVRSVLSII
jgi:hypothetical protein